MAQLYKITCNATNLSYWGIVWAEGKTYLERFEEHKCGKGGKHLYKAIQEHGEECFEIELVDGGTREYVSKREDEESKKTLFARGEGYNGNSGNAIFNTEEVYANIIKNRNEEKRVAKWRATMEANKENEEWVKQVGERRSQSIKDKWKNPTQAMLDGKKKEAQTKLGKKNPKSSITRKGMMMGEKNGNFKFWWVTPKGKFATQEEACLACGYKAGNTIRRLCNTPDKKVSKQTCNTLGMHYLYGKTHRECGFYREYVDKE
tara:strand:- start:2020 stop:2802 length:783 start_codon:yes stop_codon:yes gene_type:complete